MVLFCFRGFILFFIRPLAETFASMIYALRAFKKNIIKQEKQEKTIMVLLCFRGFILFFIRPLAEIFGHLHGKNFDVYISLKSLQPGGSW